MTFNWVVRYRAKPMDIWASLKFIGNQFQNYSSYHFWYIYTLIGIYCILPVFNKWVNRASKSEKEVFIAIWLLTFVINNESLIGWKFTINLPYNTGYIGYLVLGNYLNEQVFDRNRIQKLSLLIFIVGVFLVLYPTYWLSTEKQVLDLRYYGNFSPGVLFESIGIFLMAKYFDWNWDGRIISKIRNFVSINSYGIYCAHLLGLFYLAKIGIHFHVFQPFLGIPVTAISVLVVCGLGVVLIKKIPFGKYFAG